MNTSLMALQDSLCEFVVGEVKNCDLEALLCLAYVLDKSEDVLLVWEEHGVEVAGFGPGEVFLGKLHSFVEVLQDFFGGFICQLLLRYCEQLG